MRETFYTPEWYVDEPDTLQIELDDICVGISAEHIDELNEYAGSWFRTYYHSRNLARRPPYDEDRCTLVGIRVLPYSTPGDRQPAIALIGKYEVLAHEGDNNTDTVIRYDHNPVQLHIDTYAGKFEYLSFAYKEGDYVKILDMSPEFSEHVARLMLSYYREFCED